ncbi:MAG: hypothetical protein Q9162_003357 [Coniocarpon cinnabarinum]
MPSLSPLHLIKHRPLSRANTVKLRHLLTAPRNLSASSSPRKSHTSARRRSRVALGPPSKTNSATRPSVKPPFVDSSNETSSASDTANSRARLSRPRAVLYTLGFAATTAMAAIYGAGLKTRQQQSEALSKIKDPSQSINTTASESTATDSPATSTITTPSTQRAETGEGKAEAESEEMRKEKRLQEQKAEKTRTERIEMLEMRRRRLDGQRRELEGKIGELQGRIESRAKEEVRAEGAG